MVTNLQNQSVVQNRPSQRNLLSVLGLGLVLTLIPSLAIAQTTNTGPVNPLQDFQKRDNYDPFSSNGGSGVTPGIFELLRKASQGFGNNESTTDQNQALDSAALSFRKQQQQRIENANTPAAVTANPGGNPTVPSSTPDPLTPAKP